MNKLQEKFAHLNDTEAQLMHQLCDAVANLMSMHGRHFRKEFNHVWLKMSMAMSVYFAHQQDPDFLQKYIHHMEAFYEFVDKTCDFDWEVLRTIRQKLE